MPTLLDEVRRALKDAADPARAPQMQAYMKSALPFHGVPKARVRQIAKEATRELAWPDAAAWASDVRALWHGAKFREEWQVALAICGHRAARPFQTPDAMPLYEELIVRGAWWDVVDEVATSRVAPILRAHPSAMKPLVRAWSRSEHLWKRRTAILAQLPFKRETDVALLYEAIEPALDSKEFFLRKAIGWALREYAKTDPDEVRRYVAANDARLSGLSKREALRRIV